MLHLKPKLWWTTLSSQTKWQSFGSIFLRNLMLVKRHMAIPFHFGRHFNVLVSLITLHCLKKNWAGFLVHAIKRRPFNFSLLLVFWKFVVSEPILGGPSLTYNEGKREKTELEKISRPILSCFKPKSICPHKITVKTYITQKN